MINFAQFLVRDVERCSSSGVIVIRLSYEVNQVYSNQIQELGAIRKEIIECIVYGEKRLTPLSSSELLRFSEGELLVTILLAFYNHSFHYACSLAL